MKVRKMFSSVMVLAALSEIPAWAAEGVISKVTTSGNYCHLKFSPIQEETLYWERPVLDDPNEGNLIDFYGPCDHDPLGKAEIWRQRRNVSRRQSRDAGNE
jgi:hypothetical protein